MFYNPLFEETYNAIEHFLNELIKHCTALKSDSTDSTDSTDSSSNEVGKSNTKNNSFVNDNKSLNTMEQQQDQQNKCIKEAEEAAALAILRPHFGASESTTGTGPPSETEAGPAGTSTSTTTTPSQQSSTSTTTDGVVAGGGGEQPSLDINNLQTPQTLGEALSMLNKLKTMKDDLLAERDRNNKFVERYKAKVDKQERMATLHNLIPRELFVREDRYQQELEHVYKWSGISDQEIAEIYLTKLKKSGVKQHGASFSNETTAKQGSLRWISI